MPISPAQSARSAPALRIAPPCRIFAPAPSPRPPRRRRRWRAWRTRTCARRARTCSASWRTSGQTLRPPPPAPPPPHPPTHPPAYPLTHPPTHPPYPHNPRADDRSCCAARRPAPAAKTSTKGCRSTSSSAPASSPSTRFGRVLVPALGALLGVRNARRTMERYGHEKPWEKQWVRTSTVAARCWGRGTRGAVEVWRGLPGLAASPSPGLPRSCLICTRRDGGSLGRNQRAGRRRALHGSARLLPSQSSGL